MSDPHQWDRWDRTVARPLTRRRIARMVAVRAFAFALMTAVFVGLLIAAISAGSRSAWTLFGVFAVLWALAAATYAWVAVLLVRVRGRRRSGTRDRRRAR